MKKNTKIYLPLLLCVACAIGILLGSKINFTSNQGLFASNSKKEKLDRLIDYIDYEYVDDVNTDSIVDVTINKILENLDPHSVYIPKKEYTSVTENMNGDFVGIGVRFYQVKDTVIVVQTIDDGPSDKIGIKGGDRILYANGNQLFDKEISTDSLVSQLKGQENSDVAITVLRKGKDKLLKFNIKRAKVPIKSVDAAYMLTPKMGYIKINRFAETTYAEFKKGLDKLKAQGATGITLDLRDNPGGYLAEAVKVVDEFLEKGHLIVFTKNKNDVEEDTFSTDEGTFEHNKLYILINENSASASEIVAGAFQDNDRGTILGRRSYGKGLVQREMSLGDGSAVRLTIARYYTPTGRSIQKPYNMGNEAYFNDYIRRYKNGELVHKDSIPINDSLKYTTPGGKTVYGGGGIIPDIFIAKDTSFENENLTYIFRGGYLSRFVFDEMEKKRKYYNSLSWEQFRQTNLVTDKILNDFRDYFKSTNFPYIYNHNSLLKKYIKAMMAQQLFGSDEFQRIINEDDRFIKKVKQLSEAN